MPEPRIIGARIRVLREAKGLTQGQLAYKADTTATQISRLENNERPGAQTVVIARIATALGTTVDYLVGSSPVPGFGRPQDRDPLPDDAYPMAMAILAKWREIGERDPAALRRLLNVVHGQAEMVAALTRDNNREEDTGSERTPHAKREEDQRMKSS